MDKTKQILGRAAGRGIPEIVRVGIDAAARRENDFNKGWKFDLGDNPGASNPNFDDSAWKSVNLPHDFSITRKFTASGEAESGFLPGGTGWYRKRFVISGARAGKTFLLNFDGVYMHAYVYVNGTFVGAHHYGYTAFAFDISRHLVCDGVTENVIAVRAVNETPSSRWYSGSGIYRDVKLYALDAVHVEHNGITVITPGIAEGDGTAKVKTELVNDSSSAAAVTVTTTIFAKGGEKVASDSVEATVPPKAKATAETAPVVDSPALWSVKEPNLYTLVTEVRVDGVVVDTCETTFGYRWFRFNSRGFHLNGEPVKLNGVCMHHDQGGLGAAACYDAMYRQLSIMKDMGVNAIRTAHNPAAEDYIAICDALGLLVIEETFDGLVDPKNYNANDFSRYFEADADAGLYGWRDGMTCAEYAARSMARRDRNAASIFAWSFGNEIQEGTYWTNVNRYAEICERYISWVNDADGTRIVTSGDNNRGGDQALVNVINTILASGGVAGFNYANSAADLNRLVQRFGGSTGAIIASETASHTNSRGQYRNQNNNSCSDGKYHLTSYDTSAVPWGITAHDSIYNTYRCDGVAGEFVWTGFDYIGEPTPWNGVQAGDSGRGAIPNSSYFGIVETTGFPKDSFYLYRAQWNKNETTVHLVTAWDSENMMTDSCGKTPVWLYSNAPVVDLYLNDERIATAVRGAFVTAAGHKLYTYTAESRYADACSVRNGSGADVLYAVFHVTYTAGTLTAKAYDREGNPIGAYSVSTPGIVTRLKATANKTEIAADGCSLVYVEVDVTDENGNLKTTATNNITFTVEGPGEIAAVDNGDQATVRKFQNPCVLTDRTNAGIDAYAGKALVILRSTEEAGEITLNIASAGLVGQTVTVTAVGGEGEQNTGLVSCEMIRDYTVKAGTAPELDTAVTGTLGDGSTVEGTITWDEIPGDTIRTAGDHTITGVAEFEGLAPIRVAARLHVIPNVIVLRSVSTATMVGSKPNLPGTVRGVLADGTLAGVFAVTWNAPEASVYASVGDVISVTGTAAVFGDEMLEVTCTVRVAEAVNTESTNVAPMADSRTWNSHDDSSLTLTWATAQTIGSVNLYGCAEPQAVEFSYSLNGQDYQRIGYTAVQAQTCPRGAMYTYAFDEPISPVGLRIGGCPGLSELEVMTYAAALKRNTSADLSAICDDGAGLITAKTAVNAGITVLPEHEGVVRILTVSEDGNAAKTYSVNRRTSMKEETP